MNRELTAQRLAEVLDVDVRTVDRWVAAGCPCDGGKRKGVRRKFNEAEVAAWTKSNGLTGDMGRPTDTPESMSADDPLKAAKIRKENALADRYEIMAAREKGLLVPKADVEAANVQKFVVIKNKLLGMPAAVAPAIVGLSVPDAERLLDERVRDALRELAKA